MRGTVEYAMGYEIHATKKVTMYDPPASVFLRRLGGEAPTHFTPEEARRFAEVLIRAASEAEGTR